MFTGGKGPKKSLIDSLKSMKSQVPAFLSKKAGSKSDKEGEAADNEESKELLDKKDEGGDDEKAADKTKDEEAAKEEGEEAKTEAAAASQPSRGAALLESLRNVASHVPTMFKRPAKEKEADVEAGEKDELLEKEADNKSKEEQEGLEEVRKRWL